MLIITLKINEILKKKNLSCHKVSKLVNYKNSSFDEMIKGKRAFPQQIVEKILPILEVSKEEFEGWIVADKYPKEIIEHAIQIKKEWPYKRKSILTSRIDRILEEKEMSRTALAKQIVYPQSALNTMIIGKRGISKPVLEKLSKALEVSQNEITSWIVADKYKLKTLEIAFETKSCMD